MDGPAAVAAAAAAPGADMGMRVTRRECGRRPRSGHARGDGGAQCERGAHCQGPPPVQNALRSLCSPRPRVAARTPSATPAQTRKHSHHGHPGRPHGSRPAVAAALRPRHAGLARRRRQAAPAARHDRAPGAAGALLVVGGGLAILSRSTRARSETVSPSRREEGGRRHACNWARLFLQTAGAACAADMRAFSHTCTPSPPPHPPTLSSPPSRTRRTASARQQSRLCNPAWCVSGTCACVRARVRETGCVEHAQKQRSAQLDALNPQPSPPLPPQQNRTGRHHGPPPAVHQLRRVRDVLGVQSCLCGARPCVDCLPKRSHTLPVSTPLGTTTTPNAAPPRTRTRRPPWPPPRRPAPGAAPSRRTPSWRPWKQR